MPKVNFNDRGVSFNPKTQVFEVKFEMSKEYYDTINNHNVVEDIGLGLLCALERCLKRELVDSPDTPAVELT